jgi:hypothetical protein
VQLVANAVKVKGKEDMVNDLYAKLMKGLGH